MRRREAGGGLQIAIVIVLVVLILGSLGFLLWQNFFKPKPSTTTVTTYAECIAAGGSIIQESYPERCVTVDGMSFTNPDQQVSTPEPTEEYCVPNEKLCFDYTNRWTITNLGTETTLAGELGDALLINNGGDAPLKLYSGIGGIGGVCEEDAKYSVEVLQGTPIAGLTGFKNDYSLDTLHIARVVTSDADGYIPTIYVTGSEEYTKVATIQACGLGFSQFITGRNARFAADSDYVGAFTVGYDGDNSSKRYATIEEAKQAYNTNDYVEAFALLLSLRYQ